MSSSIDKLARDGGSVVIKKKKKTEFSKKLAVWCVIVATLSAITSYVLSWFGNDSVSDVTTTIFTACIGYLITYAGKSLGEKMSRNKHQLNEYGEPLNNNNAEG